VNYIGHGTSSSSLSVLAAQVPTAPALPTVTASYNSYQLTWTAPSSQGSAITYYTVYVDSDGDSIDNFVQATTTTNTFYSVASGVVQGITYKFKVTATNQKGASEMSAMASVKAASVPA
jgi:acyl dehydratase